MSGTHQLCALSLGTKNTEIDTDRSGAPTIKNRDLTVRSHDARTPRPETLRRILPIAYRRRNL
jgi:hypothetical protein